MLTTACKKDIDDEYSGVYPLKSINYSNVQLTNGLLEFTNLTDFKDIYSSLAEEDSIYVWGTDTATEAIDDQPALRIFEDNLNFVSLRQDINYEEELALSSGTWPANDPDDFFLESDYLRTVLNPELEVKVGASIFRFINPCTYLEIQNSNWTVLNSIRSNPNIILDDIANDDVIIHKLDDSCRQVDAAFKYTPSGLNITFESLSLNGSNFFWDFGDESTSTQENPMHAYSAPGTYDVTLVVMGDNGGVHKYEMDVTTGVQATCDAYFAWNVSNPNPNQEISFTNHSHASSGSVIISSQWDFGDGVTSTDGSPFHTYSAAGTYQITLTITDAVACTSTYTRNIVIRTEEVCCDDRDRSKEFTYFYGNSRRVKSKGYVSNIGVLDIHEVGAKTKHFRQITIAGFAVWEKSSADKIEALIDGKVYEEKTCTNEDPSSFGLKNKGGKTNSKKCVVIQTYSKKIWVDSKDMITKHAAEDAGNSAIIQLTIGESCD